MAEVTEYDPRDYERLPGRPWLTFFSRQRAYVGPDHLLIVANHYLTEEHLRFHFRDVQAIVVRKTQTGMVWNVILGSLTGLFALLTLTASGAAAIFCAAVLAGLVVILGIHVASGPTCTCRLRTIISDRALTSVVRVRAAHRLIETLRPRVAEAQAALGARVAEAAASAGAGEAAAPAAGAPPGAPPVPRAARAPVVHYDGGAHAIVFLLLLVAGLLALGSILPQPVKAISQYGLLAAYLAMILFVIMALIRQRGSDVPGNMRRTIWLTLGYLGVVYLVGVINAAVRNAQQPTTPVKLTFLLPDLEVGVLWGLAILLPWLLGAMGMLQVVWFRWSRSASREAPLPPDAPPGPVPPAPTGAAPGATAPPEPAAPETTETPGEETSP